MRGPIPDLHGTHVTADFIRVGLAGVRLAQADAVQEPIVGPTPEIRAPAASRPPQDERPRRHTRRKADGSATKQPRRDKHGIIGARRP
jgi:hypothetical protein